MLFNANPTARARTLSIVLGCAAIALTPHLAGYYGVCYQAGGALFF